MVRDYNLQPYLKSGDTKGRRKLSWYREQALPLMQPHFKKGNTAIDVGSGNGRFNQLIKDDFKLIACFDPMQELWEKFRYRNIFWIEKMHLMEASHRFPKADIIFMIGSYSVIWDQYEWKTWRYLNQLCKDDGKVIILIDKRDSWKIGYNKHFPITRYSRTEDGTTDIHILLKR